MNEYFYFKEKTKKLYFVSTMNIDMNYNYCDQNDVVVL